MDWREIKAAIANIRGAKHMKKSQAYMPDKNNFALLPFGVPEL
jgi:hypothetical protein